MASKGKKLNQTIEIPKANVLDQQRSLTPKYPKTPGVRTPADEAISFFESGFQPGAGPIRVYELALDPDGGPNKDRQVSTCYFVYTHADASYRAEIVSSTCIVSSIGCSSIVYDQHRHPARNDGCSRICLLCTLRPSLH